MSKLTKKQQAIADAVGTAIAVGGAAWLFHKFVSRDAAKDVFRAGMGSVQQRLANAGVIPSRDRVREIVRHYTGEGGEQ